MPARAGTMMCRKRKRPGAGMRSVVSACGLTTTALAIMGSSLATVAAAAGGDIDTVAPAAGSYLRRSSSFAETQERRHLQEEESYDGVLIHLTSHCNTCIGITTLNGVVPPSATLELVNCADSSLSVQKLWDVRQGGNWCLLNTDTCVFYNSIIATDFGDLITMQSRDVNPALFESEDQKWFWNGTTTGELRRVARADQCVVLTGTTDGEVELRPCEETDEAKRGWNLATPGEFECFVAGLTEFPTASPTITRQPTASPTLAPTLRPTTGAPSSVPTSAAVAITPSPSVAPSSSPSSFPSAMPSSSPSDVIDGVLIHLTSHCNTCIGLNTQAGSLGVQPGAALELVNCTDTSPSVQKMWDLRQSGNWCLLGSDTCVFYNPDTATGFGDLLTLQSRAINPMGLTLDFESQTQKWFVEGTGEITQFTRADQCVVLTGTTDGEVELRTCQETDEAKRRWTLATVEEFECDVDGLTEFPTASPTAFPSAKPSQGPSAPPIVSNEVVGNATNSSDVPSGSDGNSTTSGDDNTSDSTTNGASNTTEIGTGSGGGDVPSGSDNNSTTFGDSNTSNSTTNGDGNTTEIGIGSGGGEEYNDGVTSEVGNQTITKKKKKRKKKKKNNGITSEGGNQTVTKKEKKRKKKKNKNKQDLIETNTPSDVPSKSPAVPSAAPSSLPTTSMPSMRPSSAPSSQASLSSLPSTLPTPVPTPDDGISNTEVAMSLSVSYPDTTTNESLLSIVDSSAAFVYQRQLQNSATYLYRLGTENTLVINSFEVESRMTNLTSTPATCGQISVTQEDGEPDIYCRIINVLMSVDHDDAVGIGEVRYALSTLFPYLIERLELQSRDIASAANLGARVVPYTIVSSLVGVADARTPSPDAIASYEMVLQRFFSRQPASLGFDILHVEVRSTAVSTINVEPEDNIFAKEPESDQLSNLDAERQLQFDGGATDRVAEVTFETLILSEYASPIFPDVNVDALLLASSQEVLVDLKALGGPYFQGIDSFEMMTNAPTLAPTEQNFTGPVPSPDVSTSGSSGGLSSVMKAAIAASVTIVSLALLGIGTYLYVKRKRDAKEKLMKADDDFNSQMRNRRSSLVTNDDASPDDATRAAGSQQNLAANDTTSEASRRRKADGYGWNQVPVDDEFADSLERPNQATRTDLTSRWAAFEQDETLEQQKIVANSKAALMGLRDTIKRAWHGEPSASNEEDGEKQSATDSDSVLEGGRGTEAENEQDFLGNLQQMYVKGDISKGEFVTLKESHLRKQRVQKEEEERLAAETTEVASMHSTNPEIERMLQEGRITEEEYRNLVETHRNLKEAQDASARQLQHDQDDTEDYGYEDHQPTARHHGHDVDESFFREKNKGMERLYEDGQITREELEQMKAANERLRKSQVLGGEEMSGPLDDMSTGEDEYEQYGEDAGTGDDESTFFSNNDEIDKLYRDGQISAAEWRQMKNTHEALREEQRRSSISDDDAFDQNVDDFGDEPPENDWGEDHPSQQADNEAFEEDERRRAQDEQQEAIRRRVAEQFRQAEERMRADKVLMEDRWRPDDDDNEDEKDSEYNEDEAYDDLHESQQSLGTNGTLFTISKPGNEIRRLYEEGRISATERDQMLQANSQLGHAGKGAEDESAYSDEEGKDEETSLGTMLKAGNAIDEMYRRGEINEEEHRTMSRQHRALQKEQKRTQTLEEIEEMYEQGDLDDTDYRLLIDSYDRLQQDPRHQGAGSVIELNDMSSRPTQDTSSREGLSQPAPNSTEVVAPELTPGNNEIEDLWREGMLSREEYEAMSATQRRLREVQSGDKRYEGPKGGPRPW